MNLNEGILSWLENVKLHEELVGHFLLFFAWALSLMTFEFTFVQNDFCSTLLSERCSDGLEEEVEGQVIAEIWKLVLVALGWYAWKERGFIFFRGKTCHAEPLNSNHPRVLCS